MNPDTIHDDVTCLGCGCTCDDIHVVVRSGRVVDTSNACHLGRQWFGDGQTSANIRVDGREASLDDAIETAVARLTGSANPLVYLAAGISCETQRAGAALADVLRARLDSLTSATALPFILAAQERGFASATFGEIRNRADVILFWGIDVEQRYPRFLTRYVPSAAGRRIIAVDVSEARSTLGKADRRVNVDARDELAVLSALSALVREPASTTRVDQSADTEPWRTARELTELLLSGRYVAIVIDAEPDERAPRSLQRFDALLSLSHALNDRTRCALVALRGGGNRSGSDAVLTSQAGFPTAINFSRGYPRYDAVAVPWTSNTLDVTLVIGDTRPLPAATLDALAAASTIVIGPQATHAPLGATSVAIDTGVAGIHSDGMAYRADDVPLPLEALIPGHLSAAEVVGVIARRVSAAQRTETVAQ